MNYSSYILDIYCPPYVRGLDDLINALDGVLEDIISHAEVGLYELGYITMEKAIEWCPKDTGALASSGFLNRPEKSGTEISVVMGFGDRETQINPKTGKRTTQYAIEVHESKRKYKNGRSKFLEQAYMWVARARMMDYLYKHISKAFTQPGPFDADFNFQEKATALNARGSFWPTKAEIPKRSGVKVSKEQKIREAEERRRQWEQNKNKEDPIITAAKNAQKKIEQGLKPEQERGDNEWPF